MTGEEAKPATKTKRVRIRLDADDLVGIAQGFKPNLSSAGVFFKSKTPMEPGTAVLVEIQYSDGREALTGKGQVAWARGKSTSIDLEWDEPSQTRVRTILETPSIPPPPDGDSPPDPLLESGKPRERGESAVREIEIATIAPPPPSTIEDEPTERQEVPPDVLALGGDPSSKVEAISWEEQVPEPQPEAEPVAEPSPDAPPPVTLAAPSDRIEDEAPTEEEATQSPVWEERSVPARFLYAVGDSPLRTAIAGDGSVSAKLTEQMSLNAADAEELVISVFEGAGNRRGSLGSLSLHQLPENATLVMEFEIGANEVLEVSVTEQSSGISVRERFPTGRSPSGVHHEHEPAPAQTKRPSVIDWIKKKLGSE